MRMQRNYITLTVACRNTKWYRYFGQFGSFVKTKHATFHMAQKSHFWIFLPEKWKLVFIRNYT